jgi:hypothetical protein
MSGVTMTLVFGGMFLVTDSPFFLFGGLLFGVIPTIQGASRLLGRRAERKRLEARNDPEKQRAEQERQVLRAARDEGGRLTPASAALASSCSLEDCESILQSLVSRGHALMDVQDNGRVLYLFPEFYPPGRADDGRS